MPPLSVWALSELSPWLQLLAEGTYSQPEAVDSQGRALQCSSQPCMMLQLLQDEREIRCAVLYVGSAYQWHVLHELAAIQVQQQ